MKSAWHQYLFLVRSRQSCFVIVATNSPDPPHILQRASRLWELGKKLNPPPFQILRFEIGLDLHNIKRQEMEPVGSSAMMMICKALVIYNLWTLCWYLNLRCDFHFLNSWTYRQELSSVYPHTNIYMQLHAVYPYAFFVFVYVYHHMKNIFVWKSKLHITRVYEYTTFHMSSFDIIKVFLTIYFSAFFVQLKNMCTGDHYILSGAFKDEEIVKYIWDILFCDIPF